VLNAANEAAVAAFLARRIGFLDIARVVEDVMTGGNDIRGIRLESLEQVQATDMEARKRAKTAIESYVLTN
jgi:1-deoxy-D-xylulose-5-phosphate reductoisomerase